MGTRKIKVPKQVVQALKDQRQAFRAKFGRAPRPGERLFFDPDAAEPRPLTKERLVELFGSRRWRRLLR